MTAPTFWPAGWPTTLPSRRIEGRFRTAGFGRSQRALTLTQAFERLRDELKRMGVRETSIDMQGNIQFRQDGWPRAGQAQPNDPSVAVYWEDPYDRKPRCMAIDRYTRVEQNIAALAATIEAMRSIERHGGATVLQRAFTGFLALPAPVPGAVAAQAPWWEVLGVQAHTPTEDVRAAHRRLASLHHPDKPGGDAEKMKVINLALAAAMKERGL